MIQMSVKSSDWPDAKQLEDFAELEIRDYIGDIFRACIKFSPVYTGAYRASWRVALNMERTDVTNGRSPDNPIRGAAFRWPQGFKLGDTVVISNNQPYAELIERGWSNQAPLGVLEIAIASVTYR